MHLILNMEFTSTAMYNFGKWQFAERQFIFSMSKRL